MGMKRGFHRKFIIFFLIWIFLLFTSTPVAKAGEIVHFYHNDHVGSSLALTDQDGNVVWTRDYKPFGEEIALGGETTANTHKYAGRELDPETGLYCYSGRYYDPALGRFISVHPAGDDPSHPQSWNLYAYGLNNPYTSVDLDGKTAWDTLDVSCPGVRPYSCAKDPSWSIAFDLGLDTGGLLPSVLGNLMTYWDGQESFDITWDGAATFVPEDLADNAVETNDHFLHNAWSNP